MIKLTHAIHQHPTRTFLAFLALHGVVWTALPTLFFPNLPLDLIQLPFWALTGFTYWAALRHGRTLHWVLLGVGTGMALWAKYFILVQAIPLFLFGLFDRDARKMLFTPGPWLSIGVALAVMSP